MKINAKIVAICLVFALLGSGLVYAYTLHISMQIGSKEMTVGNKKVKIDVPAQIINGRTVVPLRAIAESLGCVVDFDDTTRTVHIEMRDNQSPSATITKIKSDLSNKGMQETQTSRWQFDISKKYFKVEVEYWANSDNSNFSFVIVGLSGEIAKFKPNSDKLKDRTRPHKEELRIETFGASTLWVNFDAKDMKFLEARVQESDLSTFP